MQRTELAAMLLELLEQETGEEYPHLTDRTDFRDELKLDSVDMVSLLLHIETRLGICVQSQELASIAKVGDLLDLIERKLTTASQIKRAA